MIAIKPLLRPKILRLVLLLAVVFASVLEISSSAHSICRDLDVARPGFNALAYAANVDATIQYFGPLLS